MPAFASFTDNGSGSGSFQFNPDFSHAGVYNLKLAAVDNGVPTLSDTASFTITVNNINRAPVLAAVANQGMNEGGNLAVPVSATIPMAMRWCSPRRIYPHSAHLPITAMALEILNLRPVLVTKAIIPFNWFRLITARRY
ncbi:MAG: hypothetical protein R3C26_20520 [Calditrichia bacterium]